MDAQHMTPGDQLDSMREHIRSTLAWPVVKAHIASMSGEDVVRYFDATFCHEYKIRVLFLLRLKEMSHHDCADIRYTEELMQKIELGVEELPSPKQRSADGTLSELILLLPQEEQLAFAADFVLHSRSSRRVSGYKIIKRHRRHGLRERLAESYKRYADREALVTLLVTGEDISDLPENLEVAIEGLRERYHQALAIEQVLARDETLAFSLAPKFPMAFIWAAGRQRNSLAVQFVVEEFRTVLHKAERETTVNRAFAEALGQIRVLLWALGRVGADAYLAELTSKYGITLPWSSSASAQ